MIEQIGKQLQQAREAKSLTLEQASGVLHIRVLYLKALEEGNFDFLHSKVQVHGFLRIYAQYLGLDAADLLAKLRAFEKQSSDQPLADKADQPFEDEQEESLPAQVIFQEIGETIRKRRDVLGLSRDDVEAHTHIPVHYVEYIEAGEFNRFPSPAQARGMLNNYASFLEMDAGAVMLRYAEGLQTRLTTRQPEPPEASSSTPAPRPKTKSTRRSRLPQWMRAWLSPDTLLVGSVGLIVLALTFWGIGRVTRTQSEQVPQPTAPSLVEVLLPTSTPEPSPTPTLPAGPTLELVEVENVEGEPTLIPTVPVAGQTGVNIFIIVRQRSYLRVTVDNQVQFDGRALPGETYTFSGLERVELLTGNAAGMQVYLNEQDMGILGIFGEVVNLIYTREGVVMPTALPTPTLSPEELITPTPTPTATLEPTPDLPEPGETPIP